LLHFTGARREKLKGNINLALYFSQALIQGFPLVGVKKAHTLPLQSHIVMCCVMSIYTFRRPDVKMTEKSDDVNRKNSRKSEECSAKVKIIHGRAVSGCYLMPSPHWGEGRWSLQQLRQTVDI
jgi:hypothetical protein